MIILSKGSLTQTGRFTPDTMALNLSERQSTATITMKIGTVSLAVGDWLQDDTEPGSGIVWRVKTIDRQYNTDTETIQLEHMINSLADQLLNGEITPATIAGGSATTCTAYQAITYILNRQSIWTLDSFDYSSVSNPYNFNGDSLKAAIETVSSSLTNPIWSYNFTTYPFKLSITQQSSSVASEMRMSRNISTMKVSMDRSRMYTRFYPIGKNNLRLTSPGYVSKNELTWGVIEKTETDNSKDTAAKLTAWANERLDVNAQPLVTVTISGLDLSAETGVDLDHLAIGRKCQIPLPEYSTIVTEMITKLSWRDKLREPENVTVTMANQKEDIASIINSITKAAGGSGRRSAKEQEEDHAWIVDTTDHVALVAEAVAGKDSQGNPNWSRVAQLTVDGNGIDARVTEAEGDIVTAQSSITQHSDQIALVVTGTGANAKVNTASIVAGINGQTGSYVTIAADKINLSGYVQATDLTTSWLTTLAGQATYMTFQGCSVGNGGLVADNIYFSTPGSGGTPGSWSLKNFIKEVQISGPTSNVYKLQYKKYGDENWTDAGSFSRATSLSGAWSSGTFTVTASPQGDTSSTIIDSVLANGALTYDSNTNLITAPIKVMVKVGSGSQQESGYTQDFKILGPTDISLWVGGTQWTGSKTLTSSTTFTVWCKAAGTWVEGDSVTITPSSSTTLTGAWSSGTFTATASPQGDTVTTIIDSVLSDGALSYESSNNLVVAPIKVMVKIGSGSQQASGYTQNFKIVGPTDISFWDANNNRWTGEHNISVGVTLRAFCKIAGSWVEGDSVRINPQSSSYTDKGSGWYCTVESLTSGGKRCRLTQEFSAGSTVPFSNGSSYHLYTP